MYQQYLFNGIKYKKLIHKTKQKLFVSDLILQEL